MNKDIKSILVHLPKLWQYDVMGSTAVLVSFSGGQSSALMGAYFCEKYPNRIGKDIHFLFGDTGQEMPETYQFIKQFETYYNIKVEKRKKFNCQHGKHLRDSKTMSRRTRTITEANGRRVHG